MMKWNKLAIELIALDEWTKSTSNLIYGAVTTGEDWRFGIYNRTNRQIIQDQKRYLENRKYRLCSSILLGEISGSGYFCINKFINTFTSDQIFNF